jgi:hypothetical protein
MSKIGEDKIISLAPTNKACRKVSKHTKTIHKFLGVSFNNSDSLKKQLEKVEYIMVDEISMIKEVFYSIFITIQKMKPNIKFIFSGTIVKVITIN